MRHKTVASLSLNELSKVEFHRVHVMTDQDSALFRSRCQHKRIVKTFQGHSLGTAEIHSRNAAERSCYDRMLQIGICLKPDSHACLASRRLHAPPIRSSIQALTGLSAPPNSPHFLYNLPDSMLHHS